MLKILLVGPSPAVFDGLNLLLKENDLSGYILESAEKDEALLKVTELDFDLLLLDVEIRNMDILGFIKKIKAVKPLLPILTYSFELKYTFIKRYLTSGVNGYCFLKEKNFQEIIDAAQKVTSGKIYISTAMVELIVTEALANRNMDRLSCLDEREFDIMTHLVRGDTLASIAHNFSVHATTIVLYKNRILDKLRITHLTELRNITKIESVF